MNSMIKGVPKTLAISAAAVVLLAGCGGDPTDLDEYFHAKATEALNKQPLRPDWEGPAPLFYTNDGTGRGACHIEVGAGQAYAKANTFERATLETLSTGYHCSDNSNTSFAVIYDPRTGKYTAYSWGVTFGIKDRYHPVRDMVDSDDINYAIESMVGVTSKKPWKLSGGISSAGGIRADHMSTEIGDKIHPIPKAWGNPATMKLVGEINKKYE